MAIIRRYSKDYEVLVAGGGMAGVCAALSAARHGAKVAFISSRPVLGGNASTEVRMDIQGASGKGTYPDRIETGIIRELLLEYHYRSNYHNRPMWDSLLWEKVRTQENLDYYPNTAVTDAKVEKNNIAEISCLELYTETFFDFKANIFIDTTGTGALGAFAGAEYTTPKTKSGFGLSGNAILIKAENAHEPYSFKKPYWTPNFPNLQFRIYGNSKIQKVNGKLPDFTSWWLEYEDGKNDILEHQQEVYEDMDKYVYAFWDYIKNGGEHNAEEYALNWWGALPAMRCVRRLVGDYMLTGEDVRAGRLFSDSVAYGGWPIGVHPLDPSAQFPKTPVFAIPYRSYFSRNIENLMMAGRIISTDDSAFQSTCLMGTCAIGGQAAGTASAIAIQSGCNPRAVPIKVLQQALLKDDCYIPGIKNEDASDLSRNAKTTATSTSFGCSPSNVLNGVSRDINEISNAWESDGIGPNETISLSWAEEISPRQVRLTFDPGLSHEIPPAQTGHPIGMPATLICDYYIQFSRKGTFVYAHHVAANHERLNIIDIPAGLSVDSLKVSVQSTYGHRNARVFEIRVY